MKQNFILCFLVCVSFAFDCDRLRDEVKDDYALYYMNNVVYGIDCDSITSRSESEYRRFEVQKSINNFNKLCPSIAFNKIAPSFNCK